MINFLKVYFFFLSWEKETDWGTFHESKMNRFCSGAVSIFPVIGTIDLGIGETQHFHKNAAM